jgi:DNA polymerase V
MLIPLYLSLVEAGFPSPADDHLDTRLDLNDYLIQHPAATFFVRADGESMRGAGIFPGDLLIVDRSRTPRNGDVVVAAVFGEVVVKHFHRQGGLVRLTAAHPRYQPIILHEGFDAACWGVVTHAVHFLIHP